MSLTQESLLSFLLEHGGKVKNSELLNNFRTQINCCDPAEKQHNRDLFKKLVNSIAVVKQLDGAKFVCVKKRYQDFVKDVAHDATQKIPMDDSFSSQNTSFSYTSPHRAEPARMIYSDIENNNVCYPSHMNGNYCSDAKHASVGRMQEKRPLLRSISSTDAATVKVLNISGDQAIRAGKSGAVFAVIAVKSPSRAPATQDGLHSQMHPHTNADKLITLSDNTTKVSTPSVPTLKPNIPACKKGALHESQCWKNKQTEDMQPPSFPLVRPQNKRDDAKDSESVPLEPLAHEWLVKCAAGLWGQIHGLLLQDTRLAQKKDFMSGFTALHWAAKDGNSEMIHTLVDISRKRGTCVNINSKAHGGYTPLHIAAIHGHTEVMVLLVQTYGANVNERDNDGKKAVHYLGKGVSAEVRALMGGLQQSKYREKTEDEEYREHHKGFNTISKLFQPHIGKKQKTATKFAHDW
ncbi:ankyrin repeat domain-containing protein SOWAHC [Centropristis striata]|uniref:ankyrin repeat domain-containing protein SOWAHC n=1 Tax=Centropristis striata TaxID=184440 RepID=UPI0027E15729|nr:ankyrin repeat domain-containing protein SOWAHC [Centropristis striata]